MGQKKYHPSFRFVALRFPELQNIKFVKPKKKTGKSIKKSDFYSLIKENSRAMWSSFVEEVELIFP